ncbi:hypothetical protein ACOSQ3_004226 [Xanthoceras sorbifolium]
MRDLVEGCCHAKSIEVSLNLSKGKFILYYSTADVQIKVVELNKETGKERLLFSFDINQLAIILEEMFAEKEAEISNQMDIDRLSNLPNHIIHHILSFVDTKCAVQTSVLSKKWRWILHLCWIWMIARHLKRWKFICPNLIKKEKFILYRNNVGGRTKIVVLDKETGVQHMVGLAMIKRTGALS